MQLFKWDMSTSGGRIWLHPSKSISWSCCLGRTLVAICIQFGKKKKIVTVFPAINMDTFKNPELID